MMLADQSSRLRLPCVPGKRFFHGLNVGSAAKLARRRKAGIPLQLIFGTCVKQTSWCDDFCAAVISPHNTTGKGRSTAATKYCSADCGTITAIAAEGALTFLALLIGDLIVVHPDIS
ncbi:hypothetical protein N656DRAFT_584197 [Canariomyces notabilis]|uniref:Uncharacterized protein n=1 Tax=Canariomyces notabilis TaxID=2074819 RepID=A0AAN6TH37_9PEZI|nr:hypothetical protein N656DRAFT_584197 [Canariomyces arenarius]